MELQAQLKRIRQQKGWSQGDLAEILHVSRQAVSKWEVGTSYPDIEKLIEISDLFNISLDELIRGDEKLQKKIVINNSIQRRTFWDVFNSYWWLIFPAFGMLIAVINAIKN